MSVCRSSRFSMLPCFIPLTIWYPVAPLGHAGVLTEVMQVANDIRMNKVCGSAKTTSPKPARLYVWHNDVSSLKVNALHRSPADRHSSAHAATDCTLATLSRNVLSILKPAVPSSKKLSDGLPHCTTMKRACACVPPPNHNRKQPQKDDVRVGTQRFGTEHATKMAINAKNTE